MKKGLLSIAAVLTVSVLTLSATMFPASAAKGIKINKSNFPDKIFREYVSSSFDKNKDGLLSEKETAAAVTISVEVKNISSLKGIEYFTELKRLSCYSNKLTEIDVSKNTKLTELNCSFNEIESLDVSKNTKLEILSCAFNHIKSIDVSKHTRLTELHCGANELTSIDVSKNTRLKELSCHKNPI